MMMSSPHANGSRPGSADSPDAAARRVAELERRLAELEAERDRLAAECRDARHARELAELRLRADDDLLAAFAHDLRSPLGTVAMGATALLDAEAPADPRLARVHSVAERIHRQAERMTHDIANLADFAAIRGGPLGLNLARHAPSAIVAAAAAQVEPLARERGLRFEAGASPDLPAIECDAGRLVQALGCIASAAIRVTPRGGVIELGARTGDAARLTLFVRDTGAGVPADQVAAMFEPGWRTSQPGYRGAVLGFALARGIADAHGGRIWATSAPGTGTTVFLALGAGR
jgi:signal transduction histidine kinase